MQRFAVVPLRGGPGPNGGAAPIPLYGTSPDDLARQVRDALRHLYDPVYLRTHPLRRWLPPPAAGSMVGSPASAGDALRRCLLDAIAAVQPAPRPSASDRAAQPVGNRAWRRYRLLVLRYVDGHEVPAVCAELAVSRREYEREHREGLDAIVSVLRARREMGAGASAEVRTERREEAGAAAEIDARGPIDPPTCLPVPLTSFVAREREVAEVIYLLETARLVTLTGPAGVGKTRLALEVAGRRSETRAGGAVFVPLAAVGQADLVLPAVARALGVQEPASGSLADAVRRRLGSAALLLVLDNFEQLLAAGPAVARLLAENGGLRVLVTSRATLRLSGEHEYPLAPLPLPQPLPAAGSAPGPAGAAVHLFVERARAVRPDFALTPDTAPAVACICRRLDGLPLAIELAAARLRLFSPAALLARLEAIAGGLALLAGGPQDAPARHQTMRGAIAWSYDLLSAQEQTLFRRLAVFAGGFTIAAAEVVASARTSEFNDQPGPDPGPSVEPESMNLELDVERGLDGLVAQSLVQPLRAGGGEPRFTLLETIREFANERLDASGQADTIRRRHARFYLALAGMTPQGRRTPSWLDAVERDQENLLAALSWLAAQPDARDFEDALRLANALGFYWSVRGRPSEGRQHLARLLARPRASPPTMS